MKLLLYIFILFSFGLSSVVVYAQKGKGKKPNTNLRRRGFLATPRTQGKGTSQGQAPSQNRGWWTLRDTQKQSESSRKPEKENLISQVQEVMSVVKRQEGFLTFLDIKKYCPNYSYEPIRRALRELTNSGELILLQRGNRNKPSVWIRKTILEEEDISSYMALQRYHRHLNSTESIQIGQIQMFIRTLKLNFNVSDIKESFPDSFKGTIRKALTRLTFSGELILLGQEDNKRIPHAWIRSSVLEKEGLAPEQALERYSKSPGLSIKLKTEQIRLFIQSLEFAFTFSYIQKRFPDFLKGTIYMALEKMHSTGELVLLQKREESGLPAGPG